MACTDDELVSAQSPTALDSITLRVSDLETATRFYRDVLRLQVVHEFPGDCASLRLPGGTTLGLHVPHEVHSHRVESAGIEIGFTVDDLNGSYTRLIGKAFGFCALQRTCPGERAKRNWPIQMDTC